MAYTISTGSRRTYSEGEFVTFSWTLERPDGGIVRNTTVPFTIEGLSATDVVGGVLSGQVQIGQFGQGSITIRLEEDRTTEGNESFFVSSSVNGVRFTSNSVNVIDTSVRTNPPSPPSPPPAPAPAPVPAPAPSPPSGPQSFNGTAGSDNITGGAQADSLRISEGADRFDGLAGNDTFDMSGLFSVLKQGEQRYFGRQISTATYADIIVRGDLTRTSRNVELVTTFTRFDLFEKTRFDINTTLVNVENLNGTEFADSFTGTSAANLFRTFAGRDTLMGMGGDDTLDGGDGSDLIDGGDGNDTAVLKGLQTDYRFSRSGNDIVATRTVNGRTDTDTLRNIERVQFDDRTVEASVMLQPPKSFTLRALDSSVNEGFTARFELNTVSYAAGEKLAFSISGVAQHDVQLASMTGEISIAAGGRTLIEIPVIADQTSEGPEDLILTVGAQTARMTVNDTSGRPSTPGARMGTNFPDRLSGTSGNDVIDGGAGNDTIMGLSGVDYLIGGLGDDSLDGGAGIDRLVGGVGNDRYVVDNIEDIIEELSGGGTDEVQSSISWVLGAELENLVLTSTFDIQGTGNSLANQLTGNRANNRLSGEAGNDTLSGGEGNDTLVGGTGSDRLTGDAGNDIFGFASVSHSPNTSSGRDVITDFTRGQDKIDLSAIDAIVTTGANDAFRFVSTPPAIASQSAGVVWFSNGVLYGSVDSTPAAEFSVTLLGVQTLTAADIIL